MCAKWKDKYDHRLILDKIALDVTISETGNVTIQGLPFNNRFIPTLASAIEFDKDIPSNQKITLLLSCIKECCVNNRLESKQFIQNISKKENDFLHGRSVDYILATSVPFRKMPPFRKVTINGFEIIFSRRLPKNFNRTILKEDILYSLMGPEPEDYIAVRVRTKGRIPEEAAEKALDLLAILLGIWNSSLTHHRWRWSIMGEGGGPIADLILGPFHTLHHPDGSSATDTIWYEPTYTKPAPLVDYSNKFSHLRKYEKWILKQIKKAKDPQWFYNAFIRYTAAVNEPRLETAFLRFWSLLEYLTNTGNSPYSVTVKRAAFIFKDHAFARQELEHLRDLRNKIIHAGDSSNDPYNHVYQIKSRVDEMLYVLLHDGYVEKTRQEINDFLDLPVETEKLEYKIDLYKRGVKYRKPHTRKR